MSNPSSILQCHTEPIHILGKIQDRGFLIGIQKDKEQISHNDEAEALGALYVLEGATLGGQVIIKRLKKNEPFSTLPLAYYNVYADHTGVMWTQFLENIN